MSKQNITLLFAILATGLFGMTFVGVVVLTKEILYSPRPETPESYKKALACSATCTPSSLLLESFLEPESAQKQPFKVDDQKIRESIKEVEKKLEEAQIKAMSDQLKEAERQVKVLEEQINEKIAP